MSLKTFLKVVCSVVAVLAAITFLYFKVELMGNLNSNFNQFTRFKLGRYAVLRTVLGLHNVGDARAEYLNNPGVIVIEWFEPNTAIIDQSVLQQFADLVHKYTGRVVRVSLPAEVGDGVLSQTNLAQLKFQTLADTSSSGSELKVVFAKDYSPRATGELSTTYLDSGIVISLSAHEEFLKNSQQLMNNYLLSSLLHEFGHQIGLVHNNDSGCIMSVHAGLDGLPVENYGLTDPQDFCEAEQSQVNQLKALY